ncbi:MULTISPECIES: hypothetical protein [unclassified Bradyrhizobium]|nr:MULTISPECIES: hypothetical protein [unclassified Bradyrhizobium]
MIKSIKESSMDQEDADRLGEQVRRVKSVHRMAQAVAEARG